MNILTRDGYKNIDDCQVGDEVLYFDLYTAQASYNTIENIEILSGKNYPDTTVDIIGDIEVEKIILNEETGEEETTIEIEQGKIGEELITHDTKWYVINNQFEFFALQSVWANLNVKHAKDLVVGDIIYDDSDNDIEITSITSYVNDDKTFYRLSISGDSSFIADGITLHNASRYWILGTGSWGQGITTNWSASDGGGGGASEPTSADDVFFTSLSSGASYTVTYGASLSVPCANFSCVAPASGNITFTNTSNNAVYASGDVSLYAGLVTGNLRVYHLNSTGTKTLATNGATIVQFVRHQAGGQTNLGSHLACTSGIQLNGGILDTQNYNITSLTSPFTVLTSTSKTFNMGTSTISVNTISFTDTNGSLTVNCGTSNIVFTSSIVSNAYGVTLYSITATGTTATINGGAVTCTNLNRTGTSAKTCVMVLGTNITVTGTLTLNGDSVVNRLLVNSSATGTARTITCNGTFNKQNLDLRDITGAGSASWDLSAITGNSGDCGGNSGITFTTPVTTNWTAGTTWSTATWSVRVPLPQDTAIIATAGTVTITQDMARIGSVDFTGSSGKTWLCSVASEVYGSINLTNLTTMSGSGAWNFYNRTACTLNMAGRGTSRQISINCFGSSLGLASDFANSTSFTVNVGTFTTNNYNLTVNSFAGGGSQVRTINLGSSTVSVGGAGTVWNISGATDLTFIAGTSTIKYTNSSTSAVTFAGAGLTYYKLWNAQTGTGTFTITGSNTFDNITTNVGRGIIFTAGTNQTFTGAGIVINGTGSTTTIGSSTTSAFTLVKSGGGTITVDNCSISYSTATPANTWYATNSTNGGNNSGWTFGSPPSGNAVFAGLLFRFI